MSNSFDWTERGSGREKRRRRRKGIESSIARLNCSFYFVPSSCLLRILLSPSPPSYQFLKDIFRIWSLFQQENETFGSFPMANFIFKNGIFKAFQGKKYIQVWGFRWNKLLENFLVKVFLALKKKMNGNSNHTIFHNCIEKSVQQHQQEPYPNVIKWEREWEEIKLVETNRFSF